MEQGRRASGSCSSRDRADQRGALAPRGWRRSVRGVPEVYTTTELTPDQIHEIGLREVRRIEKRYGCGLPQARPIERTVKARWQKCSKTCSYPDTEEGRAQIMADIDGMIRDAERRSALVRLRPEKARHRAAISAVPLGERRSSLYAPPLDGSRPGNLPDAAAPRPDDEVRACARSCITRPCRAITSSSR